MEYVEDRYGLHGLMAEFETPEELLDATRRSYAEGYREMDAYTPMPIDGLADALGMRRNGVPPIVLTCALLGAAFGFSLAYYITVISYPLNIGGRPLNSWPAYIPLTFETAVLCGALSAVIGMLFLNGMPQPYHPVFNVPRFETASRDRFFLCIEATDPQFDLEATQKFLQDLGSREVSQVEK